MIPMDPESNWDICPVCREHLSGLDEFPGIPIMRERHEAHKGRRTGRNRGGDQ